LSIAYQPEQIARKSAPAIVGRMRAEDAMARALAGSNFQLAHLSTGTLTLVPAAPTANSTGIRPPSGWYTAAGDEEKINVFGHVNRNFVVTNASDATRTNTPLINTPQSVTIIDNKVIASRQAITTEDVLRLASGVTIGSSAGGSTNTSTVVIRGFSANVSTDGLVQSSSNSSAAGLGMPAIGIDTVAVLKGADTILAGSSDPGGVVNVNRKRPDAKTTRQINAQLGSYWDGLVSGDLGGALTSDKRLMGRVVISGQRSASAYLDYRGHTIAYIAPSLRWRTNSTDVIVGYEDNYNESAPAPFTYIGASGPVHIRHPLDNPNSYRYNNNETAYFSVKRRLPWKLSFEAKGQYQRTDFGTKFWSTTVLDQGAYALAMPVAQRIRTNSYSGIGILHGDWQSGPIRQVALASFSYESTIDNYSSAYGETQFTPISSINFYHIRDVPDLSSVTAIKDKQDQFVLQDQLAFYDRVHILASISHAHIGVASGDLEGGSAYKTTHGAWLPNIGGVIAVTKNISLYANYLHSFHDQSGSLIGPGLYAPPSRGSDVEAGFKTEWFNKKFQVSSDVYQNKASNTVYNVVNSLYSSLFRSGQKTKGVEVNVLGRIITNFDVIANYSYTSVVRGEANSSSYYLGSVPAHTYNVWATYDLPESIQKGLGVGAGVTGRSGYAAGSNVGASTYRMPSQRSVDLSIYFARGSYNATLGFKNLLNARLYGDYAYQGIVPMLPGRTVMFTLTKNM